MKLSIVSRHVMRLFDQNVERIGLSRAKFGVIAVVARHPGATQRLIAELLEVTEVTAGRLIDRLCQDGYLERRADPGDRRARCVHLTDAAIPILDQLKDIANEVEEETFTGIDDGELAELERLLEKISDNAARARARAQDRA